MSMISSGTPNNLRSSKHITHNTNHHWTLSVRTLWVRELYRHDRETSPVNNQQRNLDAHIGSHIFYKDLFGRTVMTTYVIPFVIGMLLAWHSIIDIIIPISISLPESLFTHSVIHHPATNSFSHNACKAYSDVYYWEGPEIPLWQSEWQILISIYANSKSTIRDTCRAHLWSPSYVVTFGSTQSVPPANVSCIIS